MSAETNMDKHFGTYAYSKSICLAFVEVTMPIFANMNTHEVTVLHRDDHRDHIFVSSIRKRINALVFCNINVLKQVCSSINPLIIVG